MDNFQPTATDVAYWDFCDLTEVADLSRQLHAGLIHPIEKAGDYKRLAALRWSARYQDKARIAQCILEINH